MSYIALSAKDKEEMLARVGVSSVERLFDSVPDHIKIGKGLNLPGPQAEPDLLRYFEGLGHKNSLTRYLSFLGAGAYEHFVPAVVDYLSSRGEFVSPYTPYQAEVSQGTLQIIFEFQTLICQLTGLDVANASLYEGATAAAEAVLMAHRLKDRPKALVAKALHPHYREVVRTYVRNLPVGIEELAYSSDGGLDLDDLKSKLDESVSCVVVQSPNFFGAAEDLRPVGDLAHSRGALLIVVVAEAVSLGLFEAPGALGADIVTGEAQSFGLPLSFGGPFLGFMACAKDFVRQMPGRIAGQTVDVEGRRGYVLTLATREQHIRREKATSNICTNQALCALRATIFLEALGRDGLGELAWQNVQKANYASERLTGLRGVRRKFSRPLFNEFVCKFPRDWGEIDRSLREKGIVGGLGLGRFYPELRDCALFCVTEVRRKQDIDRLVDAVEEALR